MYSEQKLLVANRGEIAVRVIQTAKQIGLPTVAIYTPSDALAPHVSLADFAVPLHGSTDADAESELQAYLSASTILTICKAHAVTLVHPGYGFLSENHEFAEMVLKAGITWLGPNPTIIRTMGIKHEARIIADRAGLAIVPGSDGLVADIEEAVKIVNRMGFPVMIKATAGGGGMGLVVCLDEAELREKFNATKQRALSLFANGGLFIESYFPAARHIEVQVFGNGLGHVVHMGERECSVQRRHQKVIEETPSPFFEAHPGIREEMCQAAVKLCKSITYGSAGTVEFLVDDATGRFYFLEMNTRIQVEHPVTEVTHPGLDIVKLMILQGIAERRNPKGGVDEHLAEMVQERYSKGVGHAIEARVYCEDPADGFRPCPGVLQLVDFAEGQHEGWLRVDHWIANGTSISPFFDPLLCKLIVTGSTRSQAISRMCQALSSCKIQGPPNNIEYLKAIFENEVFMKGKATTTFLEHFKFVPRALKVISPGLETIVQDLPGRLTGLGIPLSGPVDALAFSAANIIAGNSPNTEAFEIVSGVSVKLQFCVETVVAVTGRNGVVVKVDGKEVSMWGKVIVPMGGKLEIRGGGTGNGLRVYLAVRGGFVGVPKYLGSKSTSLGLGGYQGRSLMTGDQIALGDCGATAEELASGPFVLPKSLIPAYPSHWTLYVLSGPHDDTEFFTPDGLSQFYATHWQVSISSNRMGIRLEGGKIGWARENGGEGGSHPSNILDNGYAPGSINVNGDTPVILGREGPDMGGYVCACTVASGDMWKLGQLSPGCTVEFRRISWDEALRLKQHCSQWLDAVKDSVSGTLTGQSPSLYQENLKDSVGEPKLHVVPESGSRPKVVFRQAGDSAILVEYGPMHLDLALRARIHAFESEVRKICQNGLRAFCPCIRSTMCHYDPSVISQADLLKILVKTELSLPDSARDMNFPGRRIVFPIVLDDRWNRDALKQYMRTTRDKAVYLPSNVDYLAKNNGLDGGEEEALRKLIASDWLVLGVGFYLACPFLIPIDPRCRLVGQKMNPSRTFTPRGAIGIAGLVSAIYPIESPGGYQLFGRTLPAWQTWGKGTDFNAQKPWLLNPFDQVAFEAVSEDEYLKIEKEFDAGRYSFKIESTTFSMTEYESFVQSIADETARFRASQAKGVAREEIRERELLREWEAQRQVAKADVHGNDSNDDISVDAATVVSPMSASVWKITCSPGDVIKSADDVVVVLEAMKTEVSVPAGEENVGRKIKGVGKGVKEGAVVRPGDVLVLFE